jgi:hypothetical protein
VKKKSLVIKPAKSNNENTSTIKWMLNSEIFKAIKDLFNKNNLMHRKPLVEKPYQSYSSLSAFNVSAQ